MRRSCASLAPEQFEEIASMHAQVIESLNLGLAVFLRGEEATARQLVERKKLIWQLESKVAELVKLCILAGSRRSDLVLDPFLGSRTTGEVAERLGRRWLGIGCQRSMPPLPAGVPAA